MAPSKALPSRQEGASEAWTATPKTPSCWPTKRWSASSAGWHREVLDTLAQPDMDYVSVKVSRTTHRYGSVL